MNQLQPQKYPNSTQIHLDQCDPSCQPETEEPEWSRRYCRFDSPPDEKMTPQWVAAQQLKRQALKRSND